MEARTEGSSAQAGDQSGMPVATGEAAESRSRTAGESENHREEGGDGEQREEEDQESRNEDEELIEKAQILMEKVTSSAENPNPNHLHALACLLEAQESLYIAENGPSSNNSRSSHNIGKLCNLIRDNDEFFELVSSKFLSESSYSIRVQAASLRLLLSCSQTWMYPHVFDEAVLENLQSWVMMDCEAIRTRTEELRAKEASDSEMLKTYSTGLLALCLAGGGQLVEDVLTSRLAAKLMRYLRIRVLGDSGSIQKDSSHSTEVKNTSVMALARCKDEGRGRARQLPDTAHMDDSGLSAGRASADQANDRVGECPADMGASDGVLVEGLDICEADGDGESRPIHYGKTKIEDLDDGERGDASRRKVNRSRARGRGRGNEGTLENEQSLSSLGSGSRLGLGRSARERSRSSDARAAAEGKKNSGRINTDGLTEENDDRFQECGVGGKDISDLVRQAVRAAEAEARSANAPGEAVKAAGDAAAELVKSAAFEEFKTTGNEEAAALAASRAASTVIDAANAVEVARKATIESNTATVNVTGTEVNEDVERASIPDAEYLAQLQEKYCIQCLEALGEYVEVLGPVLHEKGVDVCLLLLQCSSKPGENSKALTLLPDVMKLICALAAHRKFAAMFVDRGGIQKLLAVPRTNETFCDLSSCLFTIGSLQGIMERVCALPADVMHQMVGLAIQLLECSQDQARKNAALFFAAAFVFRAILDAFDAQDGLQKFLGLLKDAASVRTGVNSGAGHSNATLLRNDLSSPEVLTSSGKQIVYHTSVALRQYFRAHLIMLVDSIRPSRSNRSGVRNTSSVRAAYKPLDISNEAVDAVFLQLQKDRKLGPAFVRAQWPAVNNFLGFHGHITMLELCQAPPVDRYLHDLLQYALGVLHIVTLVPAGRKAITNATLSNNRAGIAVILDAANASNSNIMDPEIIQPALNVLINLVCPPPSISNKPPCQGSTGPAAELKNTDRMVSEKAPTSNQPESTVGTQFTGNTPPTPVSATSSGLVGDRRISLGVGTGSAGLAAQLEQVYRQAREAVRANNGIKVLLHLLQPRLYISSPATLDCLRALACRVLLGLARDDTIAQILTKLQVGKRLSELIRDSGGQTTGTEQGRWQAELSQVAVELIGIVTNSGRACTLAATDAATPTLRRIERAAIAAATPITYHQRELLLLIHEHLQASGLMASAASLLKEAQLTPLPSLAAPSSIAHQVSSQDTPTAQLQWPSGRVSGGFFSKEAKTTARETDYSLKSDPATSLKKKSLVFSPSFSSRSQSQLHGSRLPLRESQTNMKQPSAQATTSENAAESTPKANPDMDYQVRTPLALPMKRKSSELRDNGPSIPGKRLNSGDQALRSPNYQTPITARRGMANPDGTGFPTPTSVPRDQSGRVTPSSRPTEYFDDNHCGNAQFGQVASSIRTTKVSNDAQTSNPERLTLDSIVVQYLKHQHRQCPAPITTLPPLSLLHSHVCPEPKRSLEAPLNIVGRLGTRELKSFYGGVHGNRRDRQFVYSRFRPWRTCRDDVGALFTCITFLGEPFHIAVGSHTGELKIFDSESNNMLDSGSGHQSPVTLIQSYFSGEKALLLSSSSLDVKLWEASSLSGGPLHPFESCKAAKFSNSGSFFGALSTETGHTEILIYDVQTCHLEAKLSDASNSPSGRGLTYCPIHFSPSDSMILWNGVLWDRRGPIPVHRFDQFSDYGGGGFHPSGNEVIINSEVWDLRKYRLLRSVPSLDQTTITFNARGDIIYAILRRNLEDVMSAVHARRAKHPLFSAFRTIDGVNYSDIATVPVDRCVLDFAAERTDSFVGLVTMDDQEEMFSSARVYEIGRRRPTDDDSDPDDAESEDEEEDEDDAEMDTLLGPDGDESDDDDLSNDDDSVSELDDDDDDEGDFLMGAMNLDNGDGVLEIVAEGDEDDDDDEDDDSEMILSSGEEDFVGNVFGY